MPCRDKHVCHVINEGHFDCEKIDIPENCTEVTLANHKVGNKGAIDIAKYIGMNDNVKKLCVVGYPLRTPSTTCILAVILSGTISVASCKPK